MQEYDAVHKVYPIFPLPMATFKYKNHDNFKEECISYVEKNKDNIIQSSYGFDLWHLHNTPDENFLDLYQNSKDFENFLITSCKFYIKEIVGDLIDDLIVTDCWINICGQGQQPFHNHGNSYVSGTYYLNYDPEKHAPLKFYNPQRGYANAPFLNLDFEKITPYNAKDLQCSFIKEGDLVLWPSHLVHGYEQNNTENRITLSMNFMPKKFSSGPYSFSIER